MARKTATLTKGHTLSKLELAQRLDGTLSKTVVAIRPGMTGAKVLDTLSAAYAWVRFDKPIRFIVKSLTEPGAISHDGIWYSRVVHDATYDQVMRTPGMFSHTSAAFVGHKASQDFEVKLTPGGAKQSLFTERHSWLILVHVGPPTDKAEIWIDYTATFGGLGADLSQPASFQVTNGKFEGPAGDVIDEIPTAGTSTAYQFRPPLTRKQALSFTSRMPANPVYVTRGDLSPVVTRSATVSEIGFTKPQSTLKDVFADEVKQATITLMQEGGKVLRRKLPAILGKWKGIKLAEARPPSLIKSGNDEFSNYDGQVTVMPVVSSQSLRGTSSVPPIFLSEETGQPEGTTRSIFSTIVDAAPVILGLVMDITSLAASQNVIIHKSDHALQFLASDNLYAMDDSDNQTNPLPELPMWPEDPSAPGTTVDHLGARLAITGYVCDDNGTPVIHWLSGRPFSDDVPYFTCPKPLWYSDSRMPWDTENKRKLATNIQVSELVNHSFLMLESYVWGDDSCAHFHSKIPGTRYLGTVAFFAGVSMSRSLLYIDDYTQFNGADEIILIGQNKLKYRNPDEGRTLMFYLYLGAVSSEDVAKAFLANWTVDASVKRMYNTCYVKDIGEKPKLLVNPSVDFSYTTRTIELTPNVNYDFASPAYNTLTFSTVERSDPIKIEAGPVRMLFGGRWDNQNGWWQSVPYNMYTETDISAKWGINFKLDADGYESGIPSTKVYTITPPARLTTGAYLCVEMFTTYGDRLNLELRPRPAMYSVFNGPITRIRYVIENPTEMTLYAGLETSRPCMAVDGHDGDMYYAGIITAWLVKDKTAAQSWAAITPGQLIDGQYRLTHYNIRKEGTDFVLTNVEAATSCVSLLATDTHLYNQPGWATAGIPRATFRDYKSTPNMCLADLGIQGNPDTIEHGEPELRVSEGPAART